MLTAKNCKQKTGDSCIQQHRLRCSVAPSDASDDFSGDKQQQSATLKLLQEVAPRLELLVNQQEQLVKQLKQMRILLLLLLLVALAIPFYSFPHHSTTLTSSSCERLPSSSSS